MADKINVLDAAHRFGVSSTAAGETPDDPREKRHREQKTMGTRVWKTLNSRHKLSSEDRVFIARNLDRAIRSLEIPPGKLVEIADLGPDGTKELYRLRLPEGADPSKRRLRAHVRNYAKAIDAIARLSGRNRSRIVDEITFGTSIHPKQADGLDEADRYGRALQYLVDVVDKEIGLFGLFRDTLDEKLHCLRQRLILDQLGWPTLAGYDKADLDPEVPIVENLDLPKDVLDSWASDLQRETASPRTTSRPTVRRSGLAQARSRLLATRLTELDLSSIGPALGSRIRTELDDYRHRLRESERLLEGIDAFWNIGGDEDLCPFFIDIEAALPFLPHAYVGIVLEWNDICPRGSESDRREIRNGILSRNVATPRLVPDKGDGVPRWVDLDENYSHAWLIIYPDRQARALLPVLVVVDRYGTCGSVGFHLGVRRLLELKSWDAIFDGAGCTAYERIEHLLGMGPSSLEEVPLLEVWRATARNLGRNPLLEHRQARFAREGTKLDKYQRMMAGEFDSND